MRFETAIVAVLAAMAFLALYRHGRPRIMARIVLYGATALVLWNFAATLIVYLQGEPKEWDFLAFYFFGTVAADGSNLYSPQAYWRAAELLGHPTSVAFQGELLDVGFLYPPPTVLLFMPLSLFDIGTAKNVWISFIAASVLGACLLAGRLLAGGDVRVRRFVAGSDPRC